MSETKQLTPEELQQIQEMQQQYKIGRAHV